MFNIVSMPKMWEFTALFILEHFKLNIFGLFVEQNRQTEDVNLVTCWHFFFFTIVNILYIKQIKD